jgi:hypothetical protein
LRSHPGHQNFRRNTTFKVSRICYSDPVKPWNGTSPIFMSKTYFFMSILKDTIKIQRQPQIILAGVSWWSWSASLEALFYLENSQWGQVMLRRCCGSVWHLWRERAQHSDDCARCVRRKHYWESMFWIDRSHILAIHEFFACCEGRFNVNLRQYWRTYIKDTKTEMAILA